MRAKGRLSGVADLRPATRAGQKRRATTLRVPQQPTFEDGRGENEDDPKGTAEADDESDDDSTHHLSVAEPRQVGPVKEGGGESVEVTRKVYGARPVQL